MNARSGRRGLNGRAIYIVAEFLADVGILGEKACLLPKLKSNLPMKLFSER